MVEQVDEKRQVGFADALFVKRQDEPSTGGFEKEVAVLDAFGNALARHDGADVVSGDEGGKVVGLDVRIDCHQAASSPRGSLKTIFSSAVTTRSSTIVRTAATASITSRTSVSGALAPAVMPSVAIPSSQSGSMSLPRWTRCPGVPSRSATSTSPTSEKRREGKKGG